MKLYLIIGAGTAGLFGLWLIACSALSAWRGRQIARWLRDHEAQEFPPFTGGGGIV